MGTKSGWLLLTAGVTDDAMYGRAQRCSTYVLEIASRMQRPTSATCSSFLVVDRFFSHSVNSRSTRSSPMYPAFRSYPQPVHPVHPDRRGMFYRFYDRYRIFNDRRTRPFPFRFYCESLAFSMDYKRQYDYNRIEKMRHKLQSIFDTEFNRRV